MEKEPKENDNKQKGEETKEDNQKQKRIEVESQPDTLQQGQQQYVPQYQPPSPPQQQWVPPYGYQGASQMPFQPQYSQSPQNQAGYQPTLPYSQVVYVHSLQPCPSPIQPGRPKDQRWRSDSIPGLTSFSDAHIRKVFVRKVYLILTIQMLFTLGILSIFIFEPHVREFVRDNTFVRYIFLAIFIGIYLGLACSGSMRRKFPTNIILLSIFTLSAAFVLGSISSYFETTAVFITIGITTGVCIAVILFSFHTKFDFTTCGGMLCILLLILLLFGIIAIFVREQIMTMIYAAFGAIVFVLYLAYDTQMLMGGKTVEINPEEYIFAAIHIYIDVIYIFLFLLMLVGGASND
ncbi:protein lifeguard 1 [Nephila pilipes]|uniref:Protein lifeguard 1 n=1 Tax=Nephila pilipes TaxID=299642 RepID=A0A8X6MD30_NEPPI|nr:protein lifeguard 1 [Nephila pilipes]